MMLTILSSTDLGKLPWRSILEFLQQNFNTMLLNCQLIIELHWGTSGQTGTEKSIISMIKTNLNSSTQGWMDFFFFFLVLHLSYLPTVTWYSVLLFSLTCLAKAKNCYTAWPIIYILLCKFTTALSDLMNTKNEKNFPFILIVRTVSYWVEQLGTVNVTQSNFTQRIRNNNKAIKTSMKQIRKRKDLLFY